MEVNEILDNYQKHIETAIGDIQRKIDYIEEYIKHQEEKDSNRIVISISNFNDMMEAVSKYGAIHVVEDEYNKLNIILGDYFE